MSNKYYIKKTIEELRNLGYFDISTNSENFDIVAISLTDGQVRLIKVITDDEELTDYEKRKLLNIAFWLIANDNVKIEIWKWYKKKRKKPYEVIDLKLKIIQELF